MSEAIESLRQLLDQDFEPGPKGRGIRLKRGVAKNRRPSLGDPQMRHGRKSQSKKFVGYKRRVVTVLGSSLVVGAQVMAANVAEHEATEGLITDAERHGELEGIYIDRGYLAGEAPAKAAASGKEMVCKPWRLQNDGRFTREAFELRLEEALATCPAGETAPIVKGTAVFPAERCDSCPLRKQCTSGKEGTGRSLTIHPNEAIFMRLRERQKSAEGRQELRKRVEVEHRLARIDQIQGRRARYRGEAKNTLDRRRCAAVSNLQEIDRRLREDRLAA